MKVRIHKHNGSSVEYIPLRDYFAAQALTVAHQLWINSEDEKSIADIAYEIADAMLKAREHSE